MSGRRAPHFAHAPGSDCANGFESALHLAAKQLIEARAEIVFPGLVVSFMVSDAMGYVHQPKKTLVAAGRRSLSSVVVEQSLGEIRPDIFVEAEELGAVLVEIAVTHFVDAHKLEKIKRLNLPAIEVDLSMLRDATLVSLEVALFDNPSNTKWLHHPAETEAKRALQESIQWLLDAAIDSAAALKREEAKAAREFAKTQAKERREQEVLRAEQAERRKVEADKEAESARLAEEERRRQRNAAFTKAAAFRAQPEERKRQILLRRLGVDQLPSFLAADVSGAMSFGVMDPLLWQATLFGGLIHKQPAQGQGWVYPKYARAWLRDRFPIPSSLGHLADLAIDDYLMKLAAAGALIQGRNNSYAIWVADLNCFENLIAFRSDKKSDLVSLCWAPENEFPGYREIRVLTKTMVPSVANASRWVSFADGMRKNIWFSPEKICKCASQLGGTDETVALYLIRLGFLRAAPPLTFHPEER
jgi:hypothetical protein